MGCRIRYTPTYPLDTFGLRVGVCLLLPTYSHIENVKSRPSVRPSSRTRRTRTHQIHILRQILQSLPVRSSIIVQQSKWVTRGMHRHLTSDSGRLGSVGESAAGAGTIPLQCLTSTPAERKRVTIRKGLLLGSQSYFRDLTCTCSVVDRISEYSGLWISASLA